MTDLVPSGDVPATPPIRPELVYAPRPLAPPLGEGVIFTVLRWVPADGTWDVAESGPHTIEWRRYWIDYDAIPELTGDRLVPDDHDDSCPSCGHDATKVSLSTLVYARPHRPEREPEEYFARRTDGSVAISVEDLRALMADYEGDNVALIERMTIAAQVPL